ncbi:MAG TPA: hypothetical protein VGF99_12090 [Myxococcota bacterium]
MSTRTLKHRVTATAALSFGVVAAGALGATSCEVLPECVVDDDCSFGQLCLDTQCAPRPGLNPIGGGGIGGGGGGGGGGDPDDDDDPIDDRSPVEISGEFTAFRNDDLGPLAAIVGAQAGGYQVGLRDENRDEVLFFDPALNGAELDTSQNNTTNRITFVEGFIVGVDGLPPVCGFDRIVIQNGFQPETDGPEAWLACREQPFLLQVRGPDPRQQVEQGYSKYIDFNIAFGADADDSAGVLGRRAYAGRGDVEVIVERKSQQDNVTSQRAIDTVLPAFGAIAGMFPVFERRDPADNVGDTIAVFDRDWPGTNTPALVLLERQSRRQAGPTVWDIAEIDGQEQVLQLPLDTHAVLFNGLEDPQTLSISAEAAETVNLTVFRPSVGRVQFARYEQIMTSALGVLDPLDESFIPVRFDTSVVQTTTVPPPEHRILMIDVDGSEPDVTSSSVFYVMTDARAGWLLPLRQTADQQVDDSDIRAADFSDADPGNAIGLLAMPGRQRSAWVGIDAGVRGQIVHVPFRN